MQFGAFLPTMRQMYHTSTVHTAVEETARAAEALGFASVWANDVVIAPRICRKWRELSNPSSRSPR